MSIEKYKPFMDKLGITDEDVDGLTEAKTITYIQIAASVTFAERLDQILTIIKEKQCHKQNAKTAKKDKVITKSNEPKAKVLNNPQMPPKEPLNNSGNKNSGGTTNQVLSAGNASPLGEEKMERPRVDVTISNPKLGFPDAHRFQQHARAEKMAAEKKLKEQQDTAKGSSEQVPQPNSNLVPGNVPVPSPANNPINQPQQYNMPKQQQQPPIQGQQTNPVPPKTDNRGVSFT